LLTCTSAQNRQFRAIISYRMLKICANSLIINRLLIPRVIANIKKGTTIICEYKMGMLDKGNYIVNNKSFNVLPKMLAKMIELWTFYENVVHS